MTRSRPLGRWDPFRPLDMLASLWSTAAIAPVSSGAAAAYRTLFMTLRRLVVGRRLAVRLDEGDITLTVTEFGGGQVPTLHVHNAGAAPVLLVEG